MSDHPGISGGRVYARRGGQGAWRRDRLIVEAVIRLEMGHASSVELMYTPGQEEELALGYALTMGWLPKSPAPPQVTLDRRGDNPVAALAGGGPAVPPGPRGSGGGGLGAGSASGPEHDFSLTWEAALALTGKMAEEQLLFPACGASHAVALFTPDARLVALGEDIGRHNALDKAVGAAWLAGKLGRPLCAALSGRASLEMVLKAARAGLGLIASVSAPSAQAVEAARRAGLTLLGFARGRGANLYCGGDRLGLGPDPK